MRTRTHAARAGLSLLALLALLALLVAGCGLQRQGLIPFAPGIHVLFGRVQRGGQPLGGQLVKLYDANEAVLLDSLRSDPSGQYGFMAAPPGEVMVKVSSLDSLDFGYVRYILARGSSSERDSVPPLDLHAYGCALLEPAPGASVPTPNPAAGLTFRWAPMTLPGTIRYKVRLADARDSTVWESVRDIGTTADFNGIGTFGAYTAQLVGPGTYFWRVKVRFTDDVNAATASRAVVFATPAPAAIP